MNTTDIVTEYGAYYRKQGQNAQRLFQVARRTVESESIFTPIITDETIWQAAKVVFGRLVQAYQKGFTPINPLDFKPVEIRMFHQKVDTKETPHDLEASWLGFLAGDGVKPAEWPFVRWWIETQVIPQIQEDIEVFEIGKGVRVEPTAGTAGAVGASMNGFLTIIANHITAGRTTPIAMGALPTGANADKELVDYFEDFSDLINKKYWKKPMQLNVNEELERQYQRGLLEKYGKNYVMNEQNLTVKFSNLTLKGLPSMEGSDRIFCSPKDNCVSLNKKTQNQAVFDIQSFDREVKLLSDWWKGVGFILPELVFCNDQV
ncbi:hypothetical protein [Spirosoma sordidisoli]|uniref:Uncharacterized protein n=1 Tax=Spirosoma sordidisoli TaxID=2502893 RepID=A0A4Q2UKF2_9BACT|nr:hypothetical protein [Spirosoma sordidisoli]RYC69764.1 hypothetical protein EQG79_14305 [Spirosoma sordidisoli]